MKSETQKFFKGEVEDGEETLKKYSHDASVFEVRPKVVVFPKDSEDVQNLVKWVSENCVRQDLTQEYGRLSITARCAGTDMSGGAIGESIIMDFTRHMNKFINFDVEKKEITVEPGMFYRDFEKITLEKGMILPCYTASKSINAMGGMFGNNSAGEKTLKYGKTEGYIMETKVVFADGVEKIVKPIPLSEISKQGEIYTKIYDLIKNNEEEIREAKPKVHKNSAGYYIWNIISTKQMKNFPILLHPTDGSFRSENSPSASMKEKENSTDGRFQSSTGGMSKNSPFPESFFDLNKLLVGSQGTLGIATEITFRLVPNPKHSKLVAIFMNDLAPLGRLVDEILELKPETLESYDDKTMKLAVRFFPDFLKNKGFFGMVKFMWSFLPELFMMIRGGFPKLILLAEFSGESNEQVHKKCEELVEKIKHFRLKVHITRSEAEAGKYWDIRRESFALLRKHVKGKRTAPFIDDIIVRPEFLPKFLPSLDEILKKYDKDLTYTIAGHAGDGNFHIIPLMDFAKENTSKIILDLSEEVYDLVLRFHGSITAEHNDGIIRTPYLPKMYGEHMMSIFKEIKQIFDPKNIFNPGKKIGGTKEYLRSHLALEHPHQDHRV